MEEKGTSKRDPWQGKQPWSNQEENDFDWEYSDEDESDTDNSDVVYQSLKMDSSHKQNVALWSYTNTRTIAMFVLNSQNTLFRIIGYAEEHLGYEHESHKLMVLDPGQQIPIHLRTIYNIKPGSVVLVMPKYGINIQVEISQLKARFKLHVELTSNVMKIKSHIRKLKGVPLDRQEILYRDRAMENNRRLLEYNLSEYQTLHVLIQAHFDLMINVQTFWGKTYRLFVDPCSTGTDVFYLILSRTFSHTGYDDPGLHELFIPLHTLVLLYGNKIVNGEFCLAYLSICSNDMLTLSTVGHQSNLNLQSVTVVTETGSNHHLTVSQYDRWSVVVFMLHGLTNVPVDLIRLYRNKQNIELSSIVGVVTPSTTIVMNVVITKLSKDLMFGVPIKVSLGNGIIENIKTAPSKQLRSVKKKLERIGVPNAALYELVYGGNKKLQNSTRLDRALLDLRTPLELKLEKFPVFVHTTDSVIYKTYIHVNQTIGDFKHKIQDKYGISLKESRILVAGEELDEDDSEKLYDAGVSVRTSLFIMQTKDEHSFYVLGSSWYTKLQIPANVSVLEIKNFVWNAKKLPESNINSVLTFLYWYFLPRISPRVPAKPSPKDMRRLPVAMDTLTFPDGESMDNPVPPGNEDKQTAHSYFMSTTSKDDAKSWPMAKRNPSPPVQPTFLPSQFLDLPDNKLGDLVQGHNVPVNVVKSKLPPMVPRSNQTPWMGNLQKRQKENRLNLSEIHHGFEVVSRKKQQFPTSKIKDFEATVNHLPRINGRNNSAGLRTSLPQRHSFRNQYLTHRTAESQY